MKKGFSKKLVVLVLSTFSVLVPVKVPAQKESKTEIHPKPKEYFVDVLLPHLWNDTKGCVSWENGFYLGIGSALTAIAFTQDEKVKDYFDENSPIGDFKAIGNFWGDGWTQVGVIGSLYGVGYFTKDQEIATTAEVLAEAELIDGAFITLVKWLTHRQRPDESSYDSFPSGHTGAAFTFASVIDHRLGHKWGIPAYSVALWTLLSRMESNSHWLSDTVMGATLGMLIGYSVSKSHDDYPYEIRWHRTDKEAQITFVPNLSLDGKDVGIGILVELP